MSTNRSLALLLALALAGCGSDETSTPEDASIADSASNDVSGDADTAVVDSGSSDSTPLDTGADTSVSDTSVSDTSDTSVADTSVSDTSVADTTVSDTSVTDTAVADADAGSDTRAEPAVVHAISGVTVSTLAGSSASGSTDGTGAGASFDNPVGIALDSSGMLVITEFDGGRVRKLTTAGASSTVATGILEPFGVAVTSTAIFFQTVADKTGVKGPTTGTIWRIVGSSAPEDFVTGLGRARGLAVLPDGRIALSDRLNNTISLLDTSTRSVTLLAGSGVAGYADGTGAAAQFSGPYGVGVLPDGSLVVADQNNHCLRKVTMAGVVTRFAGDRNPGMKDDTDKLAARFDSPAMLSVDGAGDVFLSDWSNHRIRRIAPSGVVETVAGDGTQGFADGAGTSAKFYGHEGIATTTDGKTLYVTDGNAGDGGAYHRIRRVTLP